MLDKIGVYNLLENCNISFEMYEHEAVYTIEEMDCLNLPYGDKILKNLFLRDDKKKNYYLVSLKGNKNVDLKFLSQNIPSRKLSFANENELKYYLSLEKGHVTPLGILNNTERNVIMVFDTELKDEIIGIHPMENTTTIFVEFNDIFKLIEDHNNKVVLCNI